MKKYWIFIFTFFYASVLYSMDNKESLLGLLTQFKKTLSENKKLEQEVKSLEKKNRILSRKKAKDKLHRNALDIAIITGQSFCLSAVFEQLSPLYSVVIAASLLLYTLIN